VDKTRKGRESKRRKPTANTLGTLTFKEYMEKKLVTEDKKQTREVEQNP
jgi:hypothetical protein